MKSFASPVLIRPLAGITLITGIAAVFFLIGFNNAQASASHPSCGATEPSSWHKPCLAKPHFKPFPEMKPFPAIKPISFPSLKPHPTPKPFPSFKPWPTVKPKPMPSIKPVPTVKPVPKFKPAPKHKMSEKPAYKPIRGIKPSPKPSPSPAPNDCICPQVYAPVCGIDGKTYGNSCMAACVSVPIAHEGECRKSKEKPSVTPDFKFPYSWFLFENARGFFAK